MVICLIYLYRYCAFYILLYVFLVIRSLSSQLRGDISRGSTGYGANFLSEIYYPPSSLYFNEEKDSGKEESELGYKEDENDKDDNGEYEYEEEGGY